MAQNLEKGFEPAPESYDKVIARRRTDSYKHGGPQYSVKSQPPGVP